MKRNYLLIATGLFCAASVQAQTVVAELGFEDDAQEGAFKTEYALTPELGLYGDWVNYKETDVWTEKSTDDPHSGEYCFMAANTGEVGQTWERGFKMSVPLKLETPYRVSFWIKADPTYEGTDGEDVETKLTSWLSKGMENYDKSILSYGLNQVTGPNAETKFNGEWQHMSFVVYNPTAEAMDATVPSWQGTGEYPARFGGQAGETYRSHFNDKLPEVYFFIANMFCPSTYYLDDIKIEEGVAVREVTHSSEIIKVDFGYATNLATLAKQNKGSFSFDKDIVKVTIDDEEVEVVYVEGKEDGYLYILVDGIMYDDSEVVVSFDGAEDLLYSSSDRPSSDTQGNVQVFSFKNETAYWDENVDTEFEAWGQPTVRSSVPVNNSFNLKPEDVKEISMTFTTAVSLKKAKAILVKGSKKTDLTADMKLSDDGKTVTTSVSGLSDGEYSFIIEGLMNEDESVTAEDAEITFEIGEPQGDAEEVIAYQSDYTPYGQDALPVGYSGTSDNGERQSTVAEPYSGSGAPRIMGGTEQVNHGIYWGARGGSQGLLQFGKYAAESVIGGALGDGIQEEEALYLDEGTYLLTFRNGAWEDHSNPYAVRVCKPGDDGEPVVIFEESSITPDAKILHEGTTITTEDAMLPVEKEFYVETPGYYYVEFEGNSGWQCWILTSLSVTSKPASSGAAALKKLKDAIETAELNLNGADEKYDGVAKDALAATIKKANEGTFTNPQEVDDMVKELNAASQKLAERKTNYDNFVKNYESAVASIATLEGKYKTNAKVKDAEAIIAKYDGVDPKNFSDEELAAASLDVDGVPGILNNIKNIVDILTYRARQASELGLLLGVDDEVLDVLDALADDATSYIDDANKHITLALYQAIANDDDLEPLKEKQYGNQIDEDFDETDPDQVANHDEEGHPLILSGIKASGYIRNPNFYTTGTVNTVVDFAGWTFEPLEYKTGNEEDGFEDHTGTASMTAAASSDNPVVTASLNGYGQAAEYKFYQVIENIPAGVYTININSRTASKNSANDDGEYGFFNAQNADGVWDKYIFAQVDNEDPIMVPFSVGAYNTNGYPTYITNIKIKEGQKLTIGAVEHYTSGQASGHNWDSEIGAYEAAAFWDTNTWVRDAVLYFTAPLDDFDYAKAAKELAADIATGISSVEKKAPANDGAIYNLAGQKVDASYKGIVIVNGAKYLQK